MTHYQIPVLDHGYVQYIEHAGSDERFIEAARMSVGGGFKQWEPYESHPKGDLGLLQHLWFNSHTTPFEMGCLVIEVKAPIMCFREWHRHRTQSYGEMSARYVPLPDENYRPDPNDIVQRSLAAVTTANRQASGSGVAISHDNALRWLEMLDVAYRAAQRAYEQGIAYGVPKELARLPVPVARYSVMRACANPLNWLKFMTLRTPGTAQKEIRLYAEVAEQVMAAHFPRTHALWEESMALWEEFKAWKKTKATAGTLPKPSAP